MDIWFTSDQHYHHKNIIGLSARPFASLDEMNESLVERYNERVKPGDLVYMLGDFSFRHAIEPLTELVARHAGRKILIRGNHDDKASRMLRVGFAEVHERLDLEIAGVPVLLCHYPYMPPVLPPAYDVRYPHLRPENRGGWLLHGHVHEMWAELERMINVGVDVRDFAPIHYDEVAALMRRRACEKPA